MGDQLALWTSTHCLFFLSKYIELRCPTDDVFKSTVHRAMNKSGKERYSMPLFFGTDYHVNIEVRGCSSKMNQLNDQCILVIRSPSQAVCLPTGQRNTILLRLESMCTSGSRTCITQRSSRDFQREEQLPFSYFLSFAMFQSWFNVHGNRFSWLTKVPSLVGQL